MYINGTAESNTASHSGQFGRSHTMYFGDQHGGGAGAPQYYMDDLRITKVYILNVEKKQFIIRVGVYVKKYTFLVFLNENEQKT